MAITKKDVEHLAQLCRLKLDQKEEEKIAEDLEKILNYFNELQEVHTDAVEPLTGGTSLKSIFREDVAERTNDTGKGKDAFPEERDSYLKVPNVF